MDLSIIIVSYNTKDLLEDCLLSIYEQTQELEYEVIVVDNNSTDGSQEMVCQKFTHTKLITNKKNEGFSKANNIGYSYSNGNTLIFLNSDTKIKHNAFKLLNGYLDANQSVGVAGPKILSSTNEPTSSYQKFFNARSLILGSRYFKPLFNVDKYRLNYVDPDFNRIREVDWVSGACLAIKKKVFEKAGRWDENYFFYFEDMDLCYQVKKLGMKVVFFPDAQILHYFGKSTRKGGSVDAIRINSMKYYVQKNLTPMQYWFVLFYLVFIRKL